MLFGLSRVLHNILDVQIIDQKGKPIKGASIKKRFSLDSKKYESQFVSDNNGNARLHFYKTGRFSIYLQHKKYFQNYITYISKTNSGSQSRVVRLKKKNIITKIKEFIFPSSRA